jgi:HK97 family phage major capsid protein
METILKALRERREAKVALAEELLAKPEAEERTQLSEDEQRRWDELKGEIDQIDERVGELVEMQERAKTAAEAARKVANASPVQVVREPKTYDRGARHSFFGDVFRASRTGDMVAQERLRRHAREQAEEIERRKTAYERELEDWAEELGGPEVQVIRMARPGSSERVKLSRARYDMEMRDLSRTDGAGGEFVPPLWLVDEYVALARAARVFADAWNTRPLPPGTDSINIPKVATGGAVAAQADNATVQETDPTTTSIQANVKTIAGQVDIAIQLLEQSPIAFDEVVFSDLIAAYNAELDAQLINGSGAGANLQGVLGLAGINAVTYTDATPTVGELYPKVADAANQAANGRKLPATAIFMHSRRWYWHTAALDSQGRPLVVPLAAQNPIASIEDVLAEGPVGVLQGLPVLMDQNIPTNLGAGTNEDRVIACRPSDFWLWESFLRTRVLNEVGSGTLTVRLQLYNYAAATAARYPAGISVISGTGLVTPTF